ncbi:MAG: adenosylmethionine decarboxylase [Verrucomicrobiota bacterium]|nr:adenosylmethionine decarboxylase [Verrucomicrobiota bacterium]
MNKSSDKSALGRHICIDYYGCKYDTINDSDKVQSIMLQAAEVSGAKVLHTYFHSFEPHGVSGIIVIAESHFSVHAWPENAFAAVDLFACYDSIDFERAIESIFKSFGADSYKIAADLDRGASLKNNI